jgi:hypothetical protein
MSENSPIQRGEEARASYVTDLDKKGVRLVQDQGRHRVIYKTQAGKIVGIPHACELPQKGPDRWFLGLPGRHFDFVILLCETSKGELFDFVLPSEFVAEIWDSLPRDSRGAVKFEVFRKPDDDELTMRGGRIKRIRRFLGRTEALAK